MEFKVYGSNIIQCQCKFKPVLWGFLLRRITRNLRHFSFIPIPSKFFSIDYFGAICQVDLYFKDGSIIQELIQTSSHYWPKPSFSKVIIRLSKIWFHLKLQAIHHPLFEMSNFMVYSILQNQRKCFEFQNTN